MSQVKKTSKKQSKDQEQQSSRGVEQQVTKPMEPSTKPVEQVEKPVEQVAKPVEKATVEQQTTKVEEQQASKEEEQKPKKAEQEEEDSQEDLDTLFECFSKVGDRHTDNITLRNVDKWFNQAHLFGRKFSSTDTAIVFAKIAKNRKRINREEFQEMLEELAAEKEMEVTELEEKLKSAGTPSFAGTTKPIRGSLAAENMERLTNPAGYTGSHRERFDSEGKGKGLSGRYDIADQDGYVQGYKEKGSADSEDRKE